MVFSYMSYRQNVLCGRSSKVQVIVFLGGPYRFSMFCTHFQYFLLGKAIADCWTPCNGGVKVDVGRDFNRKVRRK